MTRHTRTWRFPRRRVRRTATATGVVLAGLLVAGVGGTASAGTASVAGDALPGPAPVRAAAPDPMSPVDWEDLFPDAALRAVIQERIEWLGVPAESAVMADLADITFLNASGRGVTSLVGLDNLTALETFYVWDNALTSLNGIGTLTHLKTLVAKGNEVTSLDGVEGLTALEHLNLDGSSLSSLAGIEGLTALRHLQVTDNALTSLAGIEGLINLRELWVGGNDLPPVDVSGLPAMETLGVYNNPRLSPKVPFTRGGVTQYFQLESTMGSTWGVYSMSGAYYIDGQRYAYVFNDGWDGTSWFFYGQDEVRARPLTMGTTERGVTSSEVFDEAIHRSEVRTVEENGAVLHTVSLKNVTDAPITSVFHQGIHTELRGVRGLPLLADGKGGVILRDDTMELALQPVSGIDRTLAGAWGPQTGSEFDRYVAAGWIVDATGRHLDDHLATSPAAAVYHTTPEITLAPGQSYTFSYRETLFLAGDPYTIRLEYVTTDPDTGDRVTVAETTREGEFESVWDLASLPGMPDGYEIDPSYPVPTSATFGEAGHLTTVTIHVLATDEAVEPTDPGPTEPAGPATPVGSAAGPTPTLSAATGTQAVTEQRLPWTGATVATVLLTALAVTGAGTALLLARRRRASARP